VSRLERVATGIGARFRSPLHDERTATLLGVALGVAFTVSFATGILSHLIQHPPSWFHWPPRPAGLYRITQGVHVVGGFVTVPLLLAKLWVVFPKLFAWPPARRATDAFERLALLPLVGGAVFLLVSGVANVARWYPWSFFFPAAHHRAAWIVVGALAIHLGSKWTTTRAQLRRQPADPSPTRAERRRFLGGVAATGGLVFLATAGTTIRPLSRLAALAQRRPGTGPQGVPVNKSAASAGVVTSAQDPSWRLVVRRGRRRRSFSLDELRALPQREAELPIACVEGWSTSARWRGVRVEDLVRLLDDRPVTRVRVQSLQRRGVYRRSDLTPGQLADPDTLLALELNGEPLHLDHGAPARLIAPNRPGVMQTKWVAALELR